MRRGPKDRSGSEPFVPWHKQKNGSYFEPGLGEQKRRGEPIRGPKPVKRLRGRPFSKRKSQSPWRRKGTRLLSARRKKIGHCSRCPGSIEG